MKPRTTGSGRAEAVAENAENSGRNLREAFHTTPSEEAEGVMRPKETAAARGIAGRTESAAERVTSRPCSPSGGATRNSTLSPPSLSVARRRMVTVRLRAWYSSTSAGGGVSSSSPAPGSTLTRRRRPGTALPEAEPPSGAPGASPLMSVMVSAASNSSPGATKSGKEGRSTTSACTLTSLRQEERPQSSPSAEYATAMIRNCPLK